MIISWNEESSTIQITNNIYPLQFLRIEWKNLISETQMESQLKVQSSRLINSWRAAVPMWNLV